MAKTSKSTAGTATVDAQDGQRQAEEAAGGEITVEAGKTAKKGDNGDVREILIYIGPTVKGGALKTNATLTGTRGEIKEYLKGILEDIPQVERLLVPATRLAESKGRVTEKGTLLNRYYNEVASLDNAEKEE
ncbi:MAG: hypothetical protein NC331_13830 [Lachnospiraceae bacterium]|nr:hypothetical protein [Lachnospiraceae bacterium]MCM1240444.1 hypothetical protein [Lachnospiraceae bacterium]